MDDTSVLIAQLKRQNRLLKGALGVGGAILAVSLLGAATPNTSRARFAEIDVERINVITAEGKPEIVIANRARLPAPILAGKSLPSDRTMPGLIFYNALGDENGGLVFDGKLGENGKPEAGMHFSMDRFGGDQQLALGHYESGGTMESGLKVFDRGLPADYEPLWVAYKNAAPGPEKEALLRRWKEAGGRQTSRLFVGKTRGQSSAVILADNQGKPRIMMTVAPDGTPALVFMDEAGKELQRLPQPVPAK
jgi:hypothetical protein